jgi:tetratricopeptide (TPR) repeat protein
MGLSTLAVVALLWGVAVFPGGWAQGQGTNPGYAQAATLLRQGRQAEAEQVLRAGLRRHPDDVPALGLLGTILDGEKRFDEAEKIYARAVKIAPNSTSLLNNLGNHYAARGQPERARAAYLSVIETDPHHANANLHLAQISVAQKDGQEALRYLDNLLEPDRSSPVAQLLWAEALHGSGQDAPSLVILDQLQKQYAKNSSVTFSVGLTFAKWGRYEEAETAFEKALGGDPKDITILYNVGLAATHAGHLDRAEGAFESVLKQRPEDVDALTGLARVYAAEGHDGRAVELLNKAHRLAPESAEVLLALAQVEGKRGRYEESAKALEGYLHLEPNDSIAKRELAFALAHTVQFNRGVAQLTSYVDANPQDPVGFYELALTESTGEGEKALHHLDQAIAIDPNLLPARYARAVVNYQAGKPAESVSDLDFLLERNSNDFRALDLLGQARIALNQDQEAVTLFRRAMQLAPNDPQVLMHYSRALLRTDQKEEAKAVLGKVDQMGVRYRPIRLFQHASVPPQDETTESIASLERQVRANRADINLRVRLAEAQLASGQTVKARASFAQILEATPDVTILAGCGKALLESQQYADARRFLEKAVASPAVPPEVRLDFATAVFYTSGADPALIALDQTPGGERQGDWYLLAAQFLGSMGKDKEAIAELNQGFAASPGRPDLCFEAARFLLNHHHYREAVDLLGKAVEIFPADPRLLLCQAIAYSFLDQTEESERLLAEIELRWPDWSRPYLFNGIILVELHRAAEAKPLIETAIALGDANALAYFNLALADQDNSPPDTNAAQAAISRAVTLAPEDPYVQWLAGKVAYTRKDYAGALNHLQTALHFWPDMVEAHMQLSATYRALGEKEKSVAELKEVSRIKESKRSVGQTPRRPASSTEDLLLSVRPPQ